MNQPNNKVKLTPYNQLWEKIFAQEKEKLTTALKNISIGIEHIGSTAIRGVVAKPVIDIMVGIRSLNDYGSVEKVAIQIAQLGYELREDRSTPDHFLFVKGPELNRTHNLHLVEYNGKLWREDIFFRDYLRQHPQEAKEYGELKAELADKYVQEQEKYYFGKRNFIDDILKLTQPK